MADSGLNLCYGIFFLLTLFFVLVWLFKREYPHLFSFLDKEKFDREKRNKNELIKFKEMFDILDVIFEKLVAIPYTRGVEGKKIVENGLQLINDAESPLYSSIITTFCSSYEYSRKTSMNISDKEWREINPLLKKYVKLCTSEKIKTKEDYKCFLDDIKKFSISHPNSFAGNLSLEKTQKKLESLLKSTKHQEKLEGYRNQLKKHINDFEEYLKLKLKAIPYIKSFAKRYGYNFTEQEVNNLKKLLENKGVEYDYAELLETIKFELIRIEYMSFKEKILSTEPKTPKDYALAFLELYGEQYMQHIYLLEELFLEKFPNEILDTNKILETNKEELDAKLFENNLLSETTEQISIEKLRLLNGYEFEKFIGHLFQKMGYLVEELPLSGDQGADLLLTKFGEKTVVQAKHYTHKVSNKAIQEVVAAIKYYRARKAIVITTAEFTKSAYKLAKANEVELIDKHLLRELVNKYL